MVVCDICRKKIAWKNMFVLYPGEVVTSEAYWESALKSELSHLPRIDPEGSLLAELALRQAARVSGWLVCEACSSMFSFDRKRARALAMARNNLPPGCDAAPVESVARAAAAAWERLR